MDLEPGFSGKVWERGTARRKGMNRDRVNFEIVELSASVPEGVPWEWQGREHPSGPLFLELDGDSPSKSGNRGVLDYARGKAKAEFRVRLSFPELADLVEDLGADPGLS